MTETQPVQKSAPGVEDPRRCLLRIVRLTVLLSITLLAFSLRAPRLELRPMHVDEAVQAAITGRLLETGRYEYDPVEFHGPLNQYVSLPIVWLTGARTFVETTESAYRIVPVLAGTLIVLLTALFHPIGRAASLFAALFAAVSTAFVFYNRYYVHETLLVLVTFATIIAGWMYLTRGKWGWALAAGLGIGLMHTSKETWIASAASMAGAFLCLHFFKRTREGNRIAGVWHGVRANIRAVPLGHWLIAAAGAAVVTVVLYSAFFTHWRGPLDSILAYKHYILRAGGTGTAGIHDHPWYYYLKMILFSKYGPGPWWSEAHLVVLALVGIAASLMGRAEQTSDRGLLRFLAFYTVWMVVIYSAIPYKTPWSWLSALHALILMSGVGAAFLVNLFRSLLWKIGVGIAVVLLCLHQVGQTNRSNNVFYCDWRNPYVYSHAVNDVKRLGDRVETISEFSPAGKEMLIRVITDDYWPLPWYLRAFPNVGYWPEPPEDCDAPVVITSPKWESVVRERLEDEYQAEFYGLRPEVLLVVLIRQDLWQAFIEGQ